MFNYAASGCFEPILQECCIAANVFYCEKSNWRAGNQSGGGQAVISYVQRYPALVGAVIIALGFVPVPLTDPSLPKATWLEWSVAVLPLMPFAILALSIVGRRRMPVVFAAVLALVLLSAGAFVTFVLMALAGGGTEMVILHGTALTLACVTSILLVSAVGQRARSVVFGIFLFPVLVGVWSLAVIPLAHSSAVEISSNRPFCIGEHSPIDKELHAITGLRGLSFYTTRSGYKIGDAWYFHGLLLIENEGETSVYNWSPRRMAFQAVERPRLLIASPFGSCEPRIGFLEELNLL
ncbi:MAG: hypothetical protein AAFO97_07095 [Pseudomonadota bacterium]